MTGAKVISDMVKGYTTIIQHFAANVGKKCKQMPKKGKRERKERISIKEKALDNQAIIKGFVLVPPCGIEPQPSEPESEIKKKLNK